jgi:hypothetical protein
MQNIMTLILVLACAPISAFAFQGRPVDKKLYNYSYRVKVPVVDKTSCDQNAAMLAKRFAAATDKLTQNVTGACQTRQTSSDGNYMVDILVINYQAEAPVAPYTANYSAPILVSDKQETYETFATYSDCSGALSAQADYFTAQTGLAPVAAYCEPASLDRGFLMKIESFGEARNKLFAFNSNFAVDIEIAPFVPYAAAAIKNLGGSIAYKDAYRIMYYAPKALPIQTHSYIMAKSSDCEDQKTELDNILGGFKHENISVFCTQTSENIYLLSSVSSGDLPVELDYSHTSPSYSTYEECKLDRQRMVDAAKQSGRTVVGALCTVGNGINSYAAEIFESYYR